MATLRAQELVLREVILLVAVDMLEPETAAEPGGPGRGELRRPADDPDA